MFGNPRHYIGNFEVEIVSLLSHREGATMVHPQRGNVNDDWEKLRNDFFRSFFSLSHVASLRSDILEFEKLEQEYIDVAWARFSHLLDSSPDLYIPFDEA
jgi:hypothetical protein